MNFGGALPELFDFVRVTGVRCSNLLAKRRKCAACPGENRERNLLEFYAFFFSIRLVKGSDTTSEKKKKEESKRLPFCEPAWILLVENKSKRRNILV